MITIDMEKAKNIWRNKIREARVPKLQQLDIEFQRSLESGNSQKQQEIAQKKQFLRDLTNASEITNATTIDELKAFWPEELK